MDKGTYTYLRMRAEMRHELIYKKFSESEQNLQRKAYLKKLIKLEHDHGMILSKISDRKWDGNSAWERAYIVFLLLIRRILGLAFAIKYMEHQEEGLDKKFAALGGMNKLTRTERAALDEIERQESRYERVLQGQIVEGDVIITNIRDVAFGMNDGLVELLGVVVGLAVAIGNPVIVLLSGFIVSVSGTLSMAGGAYLSTQYERTISSDTKTRTPASPAMSALYVGLMYFIGTLFPLSPFIFGVTGTFAIIAAVVVTGIVLAIISAIIAIIGGSSLTRRVGETLLISLGIALITIIIGVTARTLFHIPA